MKTRGTMIDYGEIMKPLKFYEKSVYGKVLTYPDDDIKGFINRLTGQKTLSKLQLQLV